MIQTLQKIAEEETIKRQFNGEIRVEESTEKPNFAGQIDTLTLSKIKVQYNPEYEEEANIEDLEKQLGIKPLEEAVRSIAEHEVNHKGGGELTGCPRNIELHAETILEPIAEVLAKKSIPNTINPTTGQTLYDYFTNLLEDFIDNTERAMAEKSTGTWLFYRDVGNHSEQYTKLYTAFVLSQLWCFGDQEARRLIKPFITKDKKASKAVKNFLERTKLTTKDQTKTLAGFLENTEIKTSEGLTELSNDYKQKIISYITDEKNWPEMSRIFAEEFSELIEPSGEIFLPLMGRNEFEEEMKNPETRMKLAWKKYSEPKNEKKKGTGTKPAFAPPAYMDSFEALDYVYQKLARNLEIKAKAHTRSEKMEIMRYGRKLFDPRKDRGQKIKPYIKDGKVELGTGEHPYEIDIAYHNRPTGLPGIQFVLCDTSSSMQEELKEGGRVMNPWAEEIMQWTDTSKYHYALTAWYGLLDLLKKHGTLKSTNVKFANFSTQTYSARNLQEAKKLALSPQFGNTQICMDSIKDIFSRTGMLTITMSDGNIQNWDSIKKEFIARAKKNHYFHIQIGNQRNEPDFCKDLKKEGLPVIYDDGRNLATIVAQITTPLITMTQNDSYN